MAQILRKSLKDFGYIFNKEGRLRKLDRSTGLPTSEGFEFTVSDDAKYNQQRYEALGEVINEHVYDLLEQEGLERLPVPKEGSSPATTSFIFSNNVVRENEKMIVLIHGSGVVRAGQWARRLIINDSLWTGTQIPYIRKANELGYGLLVLNTNDNYRTVNGKSHKIEGSGDPHEHLDTVWRDYVRSSNARYVAVIAHSYGGECTVRFAEKNADEFENKVFAVALTDSVHIAPSSGMEHLLKVSRNWACSDKPLDSPLSSVAGDIDRVSAGHTVHEMSSASCIDSVFQFIEERYRNARANKKFHVGETP